VYKQCNFPQIYRRFRSKTSVFQLFFKKNENNAESDDSLLFRRVSTVWAGGAASGLAVVDKCGAAAAGDGLSACVCFLLCSIPPFAEILHEDRSFFYIRSKENVKKSLLATNI
ncbi:MAG: hypothetical protein LBH77_00965, partial [Tannerella sp.]|nr:hypothetical protein [Tannerella sp.]